jgi:tetratricopeptide (TPR) repeat protein
MMRDRAAVDSELIAVRRLPYGRARTLAAERIMAEVQAEGPQASRAFAGLVLLESYHHSGEPMKALVPFAQVLRLADTQPDLLDEGDWQMLLWSFKWLLADVMEHPDVPVSRVEELIADMAARYAVAGVGTDAVAYVRSRWADACQAADAETVFEAWVATPRDDYSQCQVCDPGDRAAHLLDGDRRDEAVRLMEEAVDSGRTCLSEPADMLSRLALAYLDAGRDGEAIAAHRRSVAQLDQAEVDLPVIRGRVLQFLARTGAVAAVVRRIEADQRLLTGTTMLPMEHLSVLVQVGGAAQLVAAASPATAVRLTEVPARTLDELAGWCRHRADELARRFDLRHGDDHVSRWVRQAWVLAPHPLELAVLDLAWLDPAMPAVEGGDLTTAAVDAGSAAVGDPVAAGSAGAGGAAPELLERAEQLAVEAVWDQAAPLYLAAGSRLVDEGQLVDAGFAFAEAAHCAQVLDDLDGAHRAFGRAAALLAAGGAAPELVAPVLRAWAPTADACGAGPQLLELLDGIGPALADPGAEEPETRHAARSQVACRFEAAQVEDTRARLLASAGRLAEAAEVAGLAATRFADQDAAYDAGHAWWLTGRLERDLGRSEDAVQHLERAAAAFVRARDAQLRAKVVDDLVALLRAEGQDAAAEAAAADLLR